MKITAKGEGRYLSKHDLAAPVSAIIADVQQTRLKNARGEDVREILYFVGNVKPLVLRPINKRILIAVYGDETDLWRGRPIEVYADPSVEMGGEIVGGIRVRVPPTGAAPQPVSQPGPAPSPAPRPAATNRAASGNAAGNGNATKTQPAAKPTLADRHAQALAGFRQASTLANLDEWAAWAKKLPFDDIQIEELDAAYGERKAALTRRQNPAPARQPVRAAG